MEVGQVQVSVHCVTVGFAREDLQRRLYMAQRIADMKRVKSEERTASPWPRHPALQSTDAMQTRPVVSKR